MSSKRTKFLRNTIVAGALIASTAFVANHQYEKIKSNPHNTRTVLEIYYDSVKGKPIDSKQQMKATIEALNFLTKYRDIATYNAYKHRVTKLSDSDINAFFYINTIVYDDVYFQKVMNSVDLANFTSKAIPVLNDLLWQQIQQQEAAKAELTAADEQLSR